ncbi:hypothetical protein QOZ80_2AG0142160 [Eleusine coracana subsp. coracana]|nr:hypothetical protein QOZ80_2AG0142160 [Eleusine coracana subsp. coracana]
MAAVPVTTATDYSDASSSSSSSSSLPNWVMLDPYVFKRYDLSTFQEDETTSPQRRTSEGVSFRVSPLPAVSRLYLHFPKSPGGSDTICRIVGSHRNTLLFCLYVPLPLPVDKYPADFPYERQPRFCRQDLFVYTAGSPPSLNLLPPCHETLVEDEEDDTSSEELYDPLAGVVNFSELEGIGILCNNDGDFVVAYLCLSHEITIGSGAQDIEAQMCIYSSSRLEWQLHALPIHCEQEDICDLLSWSTKQVVAFGSYLCWVDYDSGLLFCEVFSKHLRVSYVRMPVSSSPFHEPCVDMYRNICVGEDEGKFTMMFADVRPLDGYVYLPRSNGFEFNLWSLIMEEDGNMNWKHEQEFGFSHKDLNIRNFIPSPCGPLTFPVVSMEEPHVGYFVVGEPGCGIRKVWLLSVDLISKAVEVFPYLNGNEDLLGEDADMAKSKPHCFPPFLPSDIPKFIP